MKDFNIMGVSLKNTVFRDRVVVGGVGGGGHSQKINCRKMGALTQFADLRGL